MKTSGRWRRWATGLAMAGLCAAAGKASAAGVNDSITISILPTASYSITIATTPSGASLGSVPLNTSTYTANASTVTVNSTYAWTGLKLAGAVTSPGGTAWSLGSTNTVTKDGLWAWALFTDTGVVNAPSTSVLTSSNAVVGTGQWTVGATGGSS